MFFVDRLKTTWPCGNIGSTSPAFWGFRAWTFHPCLSRVLQSLAALGKWDLSGMSPLCFTCFTVLMVVLMNLSKKLRIWTSHVNLYIFWPLYQVRGWVNHSQSARAHRSEAWRSLTFSFMPDFAAKTQNPSLPDDRLDRFSVLSLWDFIDNDLDKTVFCTVWAAWLYLKRTLQFRPSCKLLISTGQNEKEVSTNTFSFWFHEVIERAYQSVDREDSLPWYWAHKDKE